MGLVSHAFWPITVVIIFLSLRRPIRELIPTLLRIRTKYATLEFGNEAKQAAEQSRGLQRQLRSSGGDHAAGLVEPVSEEPPSQIFIRYPTTGMPLVDPSSAISMSEDIDESEEVSDSPTPADPDQPATPGSRPSWREVSSDRRQAIRARLELAQTRGRLRTVALASPDLAIRDAYLLVSSAVLDAARPYGQVHSVEDAARVLASGGVISDDAAVLVSTLSTLFRDSLSGNVIPTVEAAQAFVDAAINTVAAIDSP